MIKKKKQKNKGFSLVELVVVISIFAIMTTVSSLNYNEHRAVIERSNLAQDVALTIRQAQVYGISASARNIGDITFNEEGVADEFFDKNSSNGIADVTQDKSVRGVSFDFDGETITIFEDYDRNKVFHDNETSLTDRVIDFRKILARNISIEYFCLGTSSATCTKVEEGFLDIAFQRPYPDAIISFRENNTAGAPITPYTYGAIILSDGTEDENEYIEIFSIGNITVKSDHSVEQ